MSGFGGADIPSEYDSSRRKAKVYWFTRPVDQLRYAEENYLRCWALLFHFDQYTNRTAFGNCDDNNQMRPYYTKGAPTHNGNYYLLGEIEISPLDVREKVVSNPWNGRPCGSALIGNQEWVKCLAKSLGSSIAHMITMNMLRRPLPHL